MKRLFFATILVAFMNVCNAQKRFVLETPKDIVIEDTLKVNTIIDKFDDDMFMFAIIDDDALFQMQESPNYHILSYTIWRETEEKAVLTVIVGHIKSCK